MLKLNLKEHEDDIKFEDLEVGTFFMWYVEEYNEKTESELGMKIADLDENEYKVLSFEEGVDLGICYDWDDRYHIERIIEDIELKEE